MMKATSISNPANSVILNAVCRLGGGRTTYQSIDYGANNALAAPKPDAAFLLCTTRELSSPGHIGTNVFKNSIAMKKINSIASETYVSPTVKAAQLKTRRVLCVSTGNLNQLYYSDPRYAGGDAEEEDGGSLF